MNNLVPFVILENNEFNIHNIGTTVCTFTWWTTLKPTVVCSFWAGGRWALRTRGARRPGADAWLPFSCRSDESSFLLRRAGRTCDHCWATPYHTNSADSVSELGTTHWETRISKQEWQVYHGYKHHHLYQVKSEKRKVSLRVRIMWRKNRMRHMILRQDTQYSPRA